MCDTRTSQSADLVEVRVYRHGLLKVCEWCTSIDEATGVAAMWSELGAARCEIVDHAA